MFVVSLYSFLADTGLNTFKRFSTARMHGLAGATHSDEIFYILRYAIIDLNLILNDMKINTLDAFRSIHGQLPFLDTIYTLPKNDSLERQMIKNMTRLWTNFVKYG